MGNHILSHKEPQWRVAFEITTTLLMLALAGALVWVNRTRFYNPSSKAQQSMPISPPMSKDAIAITESNVLGNVGSARVAIIEFSDFTCSACAAFATDVEPILRREYVDTGHVIFVFKNFPTEMHPEARANARAAWCASKQGKFWQLHDRLYQARKQSNKSNWLAVARDVGLDLTVYNQCLSGTEADKNVQADKRLAQALAVTATPTFFFGILTPDGRVQVTNVIVGSRSVSRFKEILDGLVKR